MGGNALKNTPTERKSAKEYFEITKEVILECHSFCSRAEAIPAYREKPDFGDGDYLIIPLPHTNVREEIQTRFHPNEIYHNGSCYSFDFQRFQIDLIVSTPELFNPTLNYFSYNDLGNMIGRIAHAMGMKYGHAGLILPIRKYDSHLGEELTLTTNTEKALSFLGYDAHTFFKGFNTLQEIFDYALSSKYFNKTNFSYEEMNHQNRTRQRKRKVYNDFLDYLESKENLPEYIYPEDNTYFVELAKLAFPEAQIEKEQARIEQKIKDDVATRDKFNGNIVTSLTGITGEKLGKFLATFKKQFESKTELENWVFTNSEKSIETAILEHAKTLQN
jgi:hypothetical protein